MSKVSRILLPVLAVAILVMSAAPAQALFPQKFSVVWLDAIGGIVDCTDFVNCNSANCPADNLIAGRCTYTNVTGDDEPGRTSTTMTCNNKVWNNYLTRKLSGDITCSRLGGAWWTFNFPFFETGTCGMTVTRQTQPDLGGATHSESYSGITIAGLGPPGGGSCADLFFAADGAAPLQLRSRDGGRR